MKVKKIEAQPAEKKKLRVAAYCRVSTDNDDQKENLEALMKRGSRGIPTGILPGYFMILALPEQKRMFVTDCRR